MPISKKISLRKTNLKTYRALKYYNLEAISQNLKAKEVRLMCDKIKDGSLKLFFFKKNYSYFKMFAWQKLPSKKWTCYCNLITALAILKNFHPFINNILTPILHWSHDLLGELTTCYKYVNGHDNTWLSKATTSINQTHIYVKFWWWKGRDHITKITKKMFLKNG